MKPVYKINRKFLRFPRECYNSVAHRALGILSPSRYLAAACGRYGSQVTEAIRRCELEHIRPAVNRRTAGKSAYADLRRYERRKAKQTLAAADSLPADYHNRKKGQHGEEIRR